MQTNVPVTEGGIKELTFRDGDEFAFAKWLIIWKRSWGNRVISSCIIQKSENCKLVKAEAINFILLRGEM